MDPTRSRGDYLARVVKASVQRLTGTFEVRSGSRWRRLHLWRGMPIWSESSDATRSPGPDRADESSCAAWIEAAVGAPLAWEPSETHFEEHDVLPDDVVKEALDVDVSVPRALWSGVQRYIEFNDVLPSVIDPAGGPMQPTSGLWSAMVEIEVGDPYSALPEALGSGLTVDELFTKIPDRSGTLMKLLWMLERMELVERPGAARPRPKTDPQGRRPAPRTPEPLRQTAPAAEPSATPEPSEPTDTSASADFSWWGGAKAPPKSARAVTTPGRTGAPPPRPQTTPSAGVPTAGTPTLAELEARIRKEYKQRMGQDYYTFLGIPSKAPARHVERACRLLLRRWNAFSGRDLPPTPEKQIEELLAALQLVYRTLGRADRKTEYDRRVDRGSPPAVGGIRAASASALKETAAARKTRSGAASEDILAAMRAMESENWDRALGILHTLRVQNPSDADVLAELGWCAHHHAGSDSDAPEEYLRLAITFNPDHRKALEYLARLAFDAGEFDTVRRRLTKLTKLDPQNRWARRTLRHLPPPRNE